MKQLLYILSAIFIFSSCTEKKDVTEELFNSYSVVLSEQTAFNNKVQEAISKSDFNALRTETDSAVSKVNKELLVIKDLDVPEEAKTYKDAVLEASVLMTTAIEFGNRFAALTVNSTEQEFNNMITQYNYLIEAIPSKIEAVNSEKEKYNRSKNK